MWKPQKGARNERAVGRIQVFLTVGFSGAKSPPLVPVFLWLWALGFVGAFKSILGAWSENHHLFQARKKRSSVDIMPNPLLHDSHGADVEESIWQARTPWRESRSRSNVAVRLADLLWPGLW